MNTSSSENIPNWYICSACAYDYINGTQIFTDLTDEHG